MRSQRKFGDSAFTVVELGIVVAVIAIVLSFAIPSISSARKTSNELRALADSKSIVAEIETFRTRFRRLPTDTAELLSTGFLQNFDAVHTSRIQSSDYFFDYVDTAESSYLLAQPTGPDGETMFAYLFRGSLPVPGIAPSIFYVTRDRAVTWDPIN